MIFVLNYLVLAWTEPKQAPPADNVPAPLNVGFDGQQKAGGLILNTGNATTGLIVLGDQANLSGGNCPSGYQWYDLNSNKAIDNGECIKTILTAGRNNVGIGTNEPNPSYKLDVNGGIHAVGDVCTDIGGGRCLSTAGLWLISGNNIYYGVIGDINTPSNLLIHADGEVDSFIDSSPSPHIIYANGSAIQSSTQYKFGGKSAYIGPAISSYLSIDDSDDWYLETGDFTIDFWIYCPSSFGGAARGILLQKQDNSNYQTVFIFGSYIGFRVNSNNTNIIYQQTNSTISTNVWHHIAIVRDSSAATSYKIFLDGVQQSMAVNIGPTTAVPNFSGQLKIGFDFWGDSVNGYIDEFRWNKGIARWTSNFTPPTSPYSGEVTQPNGNVGIGTKTPIQKLDVNGKIIMRSGTVSSDSDNTVVTKGYLSASETGTWRGYGLVTVHSPCGPIDPGATFCTAGSEPFYCDGTTPLCRAGYTLHVFGERTTTYTCMGGGWSGFNTYTDYFCIKD